MLSVSLSFIEQRIKHTEMFFLEDNLIPIEWFIHLEGFKVKDSFNLWLI